MTETVTVDLTGIAHGGSALGRDKNGRVIFVPGGIPGETVTVEIVQDKKRFATARLLTIDAPAPARITPRCAHFGICGGCHWQHVPYQVQLDFKNEVLRGQWERARLDAAGLRPIWPNPEPWEYRATMDFSPAGDNRLGFWAPSERRVIPIDRCEVIRPALQLLLEDIDLDLEPLRKLTLQQGDDEALLLAFEIHGVEPPALSADFPISVAIVLPDRTAANLIGDNYVARTVRGRDFRVSAGCYFPASSAAAAQIVDACLELGAWQGSGTVLEVGAGVGLLTAFVAPLVDAVAGVEGNADAVADAAVNLDETDNVALYQSDLLSALRELPAHPDGLLLSPEGRGLSKKELQVLIEMGSPRLVYNSDNLSLLIRDGQVLQAAGYRPVAVQPIDTLPHHFEIHTVSLWEKG